MTFLAIDLPVVEIIALLVVAFIFGFTIHFFLKSRKILNETVVAAGKSAMPVITVREAAVPHTYEKVELRHQPVTPFAYSEPDSKTSRIQKDNYHSADEMRSIIARQQDILNDYMSQIEEIENEGKDELKQLNKNLELENEELRKSIDAKEVEVIELHEQIKGAQMMSERIDQVYLEFEQLQSKMTGVEAQANRSNNLSLELEDAKNMYEQVHAELSRKQQKLEEMMDDNQSMRHHMHVLEDKLAESNLQRQQLQKRIIFLQEVNNDMQGLADSNKKMQTELRRISELESMLTMMAEERDYLLRKKREE